MGKTVAKNQSGMKWFLDVDVTFPNKSRCCGVGCRESTGEFLTSEELLFLHVASKLK